MVIRGGAALARHGPGPGSDGRRPWRGARV